MCLANTSELAYQLPGITQHSRVKRQQADFGSHTYLHTLPLQGRGNEVLQNLTALDIWQIASSLLLINGQCVKHTELGDM